MDTVPTTMTLTQASHLKTLCEEAGETFDPELSREDAVRRIEELQERLGLGHLNQDLSPP
jgi:hypothetical protein